VAVGGGFPALLASCRRPDAPPPTPQAAIAGAQPARPARDWHAAQECGRAPPHQRQAACPGPLSLTAFDLSCKREVQQRDISPLRCRSSPHMRRFS